jgi:DNA-binding transcriptional regulator YhcF (GntR family)
MSPTLKNEKGYKFYIWSNEEKRIHVHVSKENKSTKIWIEPVIEVAENNGFSTKELNTILKTVTENEIEFKAKYRTHVG